MRILLIGSVPIEVGGRTRGGLATHVWNLATHLAERNHQVAVFADNYVTESTAPETRDRIQIFGRCRPLRALQNLRWISPSFWKKVYRIKRHACHLQHLTGIIVKSLDYQRVIDLFQPDLIHVHDLLIRTLYACCLAPHRLSIVTTVHSSVLLDFAEPSVKELRHQLVRQNLTDAPHLIFVSQQVKSRFEELFPRELAGLKSTVIHDPIDVQRYYPIARQKALQYIQADPTPPLILFVGKLISRKGPRVLIEAMDKLRAKGLHAKLMIVGDGPEKAELKMLIQEKTLMSIISLEGSKSQMELPYYYSAADLFVLPTLSEGFGQVFVEAMACGCPVIGTEAVPKELIRSKEYGLVVPPNDIGSLAEAMEKALNHSWDREKIRAYALQFDWTTRIHDFEQVYRKITGFSD